MKHAYHKDILRSILKNKKRFLSIVLITALGMTVLTGIYAACQDMYASADQFYDDQNLFDIRVMSTLGLTDDDVAALQQMDGVEVADGAYAETVHTEAGGARKTAQMETLSQRGLNMPYLVEGALPQRSGEIAVTQKYLDGTGKSIGDTLTIEEDLDEETLDGVEAETVHDAIADTNADADDPGTDGSDMDTDIDWDADIDTEDEEAPTFPLTTYIITGIVIDPMHINSGDGGKAFRSTASADYNFYIISADADTDIYTTVHLTLTGLSGLSCYSDVYDDAVQTVVGAIEAQIMEPREQARYDGVMAEAQKKLSDAEDEMNEKLTDAERQFADAWAEIRDGRRELADGETELHEQEAEAQDQIADARRQIKRQKAKLAAAEDEWAAGDAAWNENARKLADGKQQLAQQRQDAETGFAAAESRFEAEQAKLDDSINQLMPGIDQLKALFGASWPETEWNALVSAVAAQAFALITADPDSDPDPAVIAAATPDEQNSLAAAVAMAGDPMLAGMASNCVQAGLSLGLLQGAQQALDAQKAAFDAQKAAALQQMSDAENELAANEAQLTAARQQLDDGKAQIENGWVQLKKGEKKLDQQETDAEQAFADARQEITNNRKKLDDGEAELRENEQKYREKKAEAKAQLDDAHAALNDIDMTQWYVQGRTSLDSYSGMKNEMASIEAIGRIFPAIFLIVAILISLTTMTRMVEEERGLIGTYKAIGLSNGAIYWKYLLYALLASAAGGMLGNFLGFFILPRFLLGVLSTLYTIPYSVLQFDALYGICGALLFIAGIAVATIWACRAELRHAPAVLLRPKAPKAGLRVLLERIPLIWNHLKFLNKVTARNLFRYKKRLIMTIAGIMGCTTLLMIGFTIKDTVTHLNPMQYDDICRYDLMLVAGDEDDNQLTGLLDNESAIVDYMSVQLTNVKVINEQGTAESMQMMVIPEGAPLADYISTPDSAGTAATLDDSGIFLTRNAADLLNVSAGDSISLQNLRLDQRQVAAADIVQNYLGNYVYISQSLYSSLFSDYAPNAALAHLADSVPDQEAYAEKLLGSHDYIRSAVSTAELKAGFAQNFTMLNAVILLFIGMAGGLAFVVLFTLSNTNISERVRELATIKVLGFYDMEVHSYVNKETLILTAIGVLAGLPVGYGVSSLIISTLRIPSVYFAVTIEPVSYLFAGIISLGFGLVVSLITNKTLDRINMVEALKSVE